nr:MAG TPA: hypothetical protein [Caudoviricetes sp.]
MFRQNGLELLVKLCFKNPLTGTVNFGKGSCNFEK